MNDELLIDPLAAAIYVARIAHVRQRDKAGQLYIGHPLRVMERMPKSDVLGRMVAVLHDVIEDTEFSAPQLREMGFSNPVVDALELLTHRSGETYADYIRRVRVNELARRVKVADIADNSDEERLAELPPAEAVRLRTKYAEAKRLLLRAEMSTVDLLPLVRAAMGGPGSFVDEDELAADLDTTKERIGYALSSMRCDGEVELVVRLSCTGGHLALEFVIGKDDSAEALARAPERCAVCSVVLRAAGSVVAFRTRVVARSEAP